MGYRSEAQKRWFDEHKEHVREYQRVYREKNRERILQQQRDWWWAHRDEQLKKYRARYIPHPLPLKTKEEKRAYRSCWKHKRRAVNRLATPCWLTVEHDHAMKDMQMTAQMLRRSGLDFHVDHIVPLMNGRVCGLNVPWNMQVIPASINFRKNNKLWPHMP